MKNLALVAALVLATTTASIRAADACGGYGQPPQQQEMRFQHRVAAFPGMQAKGVWPRLEREGATTILTLSYPQFGIEGPHLYMDTFEVVRDRNLRRLERTLAARKWPNLDVTVERVDGHRWKVVGWKTRA
jgi:hypothetical protein